MTETNSPALVSDKQAAEWQLERDALRELLRRIANGETVATATLWAASRGEPVNLGHSDKGD